MNRELKQAWGVKYMLGPWCQVCNKHRGHLIKLMQYKKISVLFDSLMCVFFSRQLLLIGGVDPMEDIQKFKSNGWVQ